MNIYNTLYKIINEFKKVRVGRYMEAKSKRSINLCHMNSSDVVPVELIDVMVMYLLVSPLDIVRVKQYK